MKPWSSLMCTGLRRATLLFSCCVAVCLSATLQAHAAASSAETEIRAVLEAQRNAWNRADVDGYMNGYARGGATEFISGDKLTRGWGTVRNQYKTKYGTREAMGVLTFSEIDVHSLGNDAAFVTGLWSLQRKEDNPHGRFTLIFRHTNDGWRIVHDHTSSATP